MTTADHTAHDQPTGQDRPVTVAVRGLTKTYGHGAAQVAAVRDVDLDVHAGEVLLVMGPERLGQDHAAADAGGAASPHRRIHRRHRPGPPQCRDRDHDGA